VRLPCRLLAAVLAVGAASQVRARLPRARRGGRRGGSHQAADYRNNEFLGRIEAVNRVNVVARVTAFLEKGCSWRAEIKAARSFTSLSAVRPGRSRHQEGPGRQLQRRSNAKLTTDARSRCLAGRRQQSTYDARSPPSAAWRRRCGRAGPGRSLPDQPRLHRHPLAGRRQGRPHRGDRRQRGQPGVGRADDHRQQDRCT